MAAPAPSSGAPSRGCTVTHFVSKDFFSRQPTMLCAARTQGVAPHWLLGVPELSKLQSPGTCPEETAARARVFNRGVIGFPFCDPRRRIGAPEGKRRKVGAAL
jgi:hypothetical protein